MNSSQFAEGHDFIAFRILGAVELAAPDGEMRILSGRQQGVLSLLLIKVDHVVSMDQLVDAIWNETPPSTARAQVQFCIHALRTEFERLQLPARIVTQAPGYRLEVENRAQIDSHRFEILVNGARALARKGAVEEAAAALRAALGLWRGPLLDGSSQIIRDQATWLEELRLEVIEECIGHELELGKHRELIGELRTLVAEYPLNEQFRFLLMLALYRSGRQWDALDVYRAGRAIMVEQLGLDPGPKLQRLEEAILANDKALLREEPAAPVPAPRAQSWTRPRQLPAAIADFTGREDLVDTIATLLVPDPEAATAVPIVSLTGKAGVGKSALAVYVAHRVAAEHFPDGQLYVNLRSTTGHAVTAHDALGRFLRALGVNGESIPDSEDERGEMYRGMLADRRVLVVLEDADTEAQVRPVVPGSSTCAVLVTSRIRLTGLFGATGLPVDVLTAEQSLLLLERAIGAERLKREPDEARAIADTVGGLPLALRIIGARLAARPHWTLRSMVDRLADETQRLDELAHGDMIVRSSLQMTYENLDTSSAKLMGRLGALDADELPEWTAAAVMDDDTGRAPDLLDRLVDAQLLDTVVGESVMTPRYRFHDLIRIFARERLRSSQPEAETGVLQRVLGAWLGMAETAHCRLYGGNFTTLHGTGVRWKVPAEHSDVVLSDPLRWLETERTNICAAITQGADAGLDELCWELAVSLVSLFEVRSYFDDWLTTHEHALRATRAACNTRGTAAVLCSLGSLYLNQNRLEQARSTLMPAYEFFAVLGDTHGLALTQRNLGLHDRQAGAVESALNHYNQALNGFQEVGDLVGQASVLSQMAQIDLDQGNQTRALGLLQRAVGICRTVRSPRIESQVRYKMGKALVAQGDYETAGQLLSEVLELVREANDIQGERYALHMIGVIEKNRGRLTRAAQLLQSSMELCERGLDHVGAARARLELADVESMRGAAKAAHALAEQARAVFVEYKMQKWADAAAKHISAG